MHDFSCFLLAVGHSTGQRAPNEPWPLPPDQQPVKGKCALPPRTPLRSEETATSKGRGMDGVLVSLKGAQDLPQRLAMKANKSMP